MKLATAILVVMSSHAVSPALLRAQEQAQAPALSIEKRSEDLSTWLKEYREWEKWFEQWGNRVARNNSDFHIWGRKKRPDPPVWLAQVCAEAPVMDDQLASGCHILATWDDQPIQIMRRRGSAVATSGGNAADTVVKSSFLQRIHLTGLWTRAQYPGTPVYGIIGMQISVVEIGRVTLPATGVMLVMLPDGAGGHDWKPAATLGFGLRLFDFIAPVRKKPLSLHVNIASTQILGLQGERILSGRSNISFIGFSVSASRRR